MKRKRIITICISLVTIEANMWTSTGRINNLPTYGEVKGVLKNQTCKKAVNANEIVYLSTLINLTAFLITY